MTGRGARPRTLEGILRLQCPAVMLNSQRSPLQQELYSLTVSFSRQSAYLVVTEGAQKNEPRLSSLLSR